MRYYGYRHYSPELGRWVSRDPVGEAEQSSHFVLCLNDPINEFDVDGLLSWSTCRQVTLAAINEGGFPDPVGRQLVDWLKKNRCAFSIDCIECEDNCDKVGVKYADASPRDGYVPGRGYCQIRVCASRASYHSIAGWLRHELAHCASYCSGDQNRDCASRLCREIYAYHWQIACGNPSGSGYNDCLARRAKRSAGSQEECKGVNMDEILTSDFINACIPGGNKTRPHPEIL